LKKLFICISIVYLTVSCAKMNNAKLNEFRPGEIWLDTQGNPINAHSAGLLFHDGIYYWYGEIKSGKTWLPEANSTWEGYRVNAGGVSCYSSKDLYNWKYEGVALSPVQNDTSHDLHISKVIERPKVIYNDKTEKFVMWMHIDSEDYSYARAGVAVSETPVGPFVYIDSIRPNGEMSRDMTLFKDDDGKAYHFYSSEFNATMYISLLTDDYLKPSGIFKREFIDRSREAPAVFKHNNKYYIISSGCTGWIPNPAEYAVADSILGEWEVKGNPCVGKGKDSTFIAQSTFVLPVQGKENAFIFLADRWNKTDLPDSRYVWLPLRIKNKTSSIEWMDKWDLSVF
jgi:beta-xylosidase